MGKKNNRLTNGEQLMSNAPLRDAELSSTEKGGGKPVDTKKKKKKSDKPGIFKRIGKFFADMFRELKAVDWPKAKRVFAALGVVLLVVVIFLVIITAFDAAFAELLKLLIGAN